LASVSRPVSASWKLETTSRTIGLATRKTSTAIMTSHSSMLGSSRLSRRAMAAGNPGCDSASTRLMLAIGNSANGREGRSHPEGLAPLLDHLGDAFEDFLDARPDRLQLLGGFHPSRGRNFGPDRLAEMIDPDLRGID